MDGATSNGRFCWPNKTGVTANALFRRCPDILLFKSIALCAFLWRLISIYRTRLSISTVIYCRKHFSNPLRHCKVFHIAITWCIIIFLKVMKPKRRWTGHQTSPATSTSDAKRLIGDKFSDAPVRSDTQMWPFKVVAGREDKPVIIVQYREEEKQFSAEEISSMVLRKMKETAEAYLGSTVTNIVVTVSAYFNCLQRGAIIDAGAIAGLNVMCILSVHTAAAIAYGFDRITGNGHVRNVYIFDLSGGTFDASVVTIELVEECLKDAKMDKNFIDDVVLVDGSTRISKVQELLHNYFNKELCKSINPDEAVAFGADVHAAILTGEGNAKVQGLVVADVNPLSLGAKFHSGAMKVFVPRNTPIPARKEGVVQTVLDYQTSISYPIFKGERPMADHNHLLGQFVLSGIPYALRGVSKTTVCFDIDANGILNVSAEDQSYGHKSGIIGTNGKRLNNEEIEKMILEAEKQKLQDLMYEKKQETWNSLANYSYQMRHALREVKVALKLSLYDGKKKNV